MHRPSRNSWLFVAAFTAAFLMPPGFTATLKVHFDLPVEALGKALRDFAVQANCNISYEPSIVAGLQSPAINGEYTISAALMLLLKGTQLVGINVNDDTIQVLPKPTPTPQQDTPTWNASSPAAGARQRYSGPL